MPRFIPDGFGNLIRSREVFFTPIRNLFKDKTHLGIQNNLDIRRGASLLCLSETFGRKLVYPRERVVAGDEVRKVLNKRAIKTIKESATNVGGKLRIVKVKLCELWLLSSRRLEGSG